MSFDVIRKEGRLLYEYIRGSRCHGIATAQSDIDTGGVFIPKIDEIFGIGVSVKEQVQSKKSDDVWYSLDKFLRLLLTSNPTMLEALFVPDWCVKYEHPLITEIKNNRDVFLTKACFNSFGGYAVAQIKKARGLNKKINIKTIERKTPFDFCYTFYEQGSTKLLNWLDNRGMLQEACGLVSVPNMHDVYAVYYDWGKHNRLKDIDNNVEEFGYRGIIAEDSNQIRLSSIPKNEKPICYISYNESGYTKHCIDYKNFKDWEENRNPVRYQSNLDKNYDAKNMCECFRLVRMCTEVANGNTLLCDRTNIDREFLLSIKEHKYEYDELLSILETEKNIMDEAIKNSTIQDKIDVNFVNQLSINIKKKFYNISF